MMKNKYKTSKEVKIKLSVGDCIGKVFDLNDAQRVSIPYKELREDHKYRVLERCDL